MPFAGSPAVPPLGPHTCVKVNRTSQSSCSNRQSAEGENAHTQYCRDLKRCILQLFFFSGASDPLTMPSWFPKLMFMWRFRFSASDLIPLHRWNGRKSSIPHVHTPHITPPSPSVRGLLRASECPLYQTPEIIICQLVGLEGLLRCIDLHCRPTGRTGGWSVGLYTQSTW